MLVFRAQHLSPDRTPPFQLESLLYHEVAELGGDTLWADLQAAYDDLSEPFERLSSSVTAVYDADPEHYAQGGERGSRTVEQPVVLAHPETGRKGLFLSTGALRLVGVSEAESAVLLPYLRAYQKVIAAHPATGSGG